MCMCTHVHICTHTQCAFDVQQPGVWDLAGLPHLVTSLDCGQVYWSPKVMGWHCSEPLLTASWRRMGRWTLFLPHHLPLGLRKVCWVASLIVRLKLNILIGIEEVYLRYWLGSILLPFSKINTIFSIIQSSHLSPKSLLPIKKKKIITAFVRHLTVYNPYHLLQIFLFYFRILMKFFICPFHISSIMSRTQLIFPQTIWKRIGAISCTLLILELDQTFLGKICTIFQNLYNFLIMPQNVLAHCLNFIHNVVFPIYQIIAIFIDLNFLGDHIWKTLGWRSQIERDNPGRNK